MRSEAALNPSVRVVQAEFPPGSKMDIWPATWSRGRALGATPHK